MRALMLSVSALLLLTSPTFAQQPSQLPYAPLNQQQTQRFIEFLAEVSMPNKAYQQVVGAYSELLRQAQLEKAQSDAIAARGGKPAPEEGFAK